MIPALNGSFLLQHFECGNAFKLRNGTVFNLYPYQFVQTEGEGVGKKRTMEETMEEGEGGEGIYLHGWHVIDLLTKSYMFAYE